MKKAGNIDARSLIEKAMRGGRKFLPLRVLKSKKKKT
jgi:hypothetical protein